MFRETLSVLQTRAIQGGTSALVTESVLGPCSLDFLPPTHAAELVFSGQGLLPQSCNKAWELNRPSGAIQSSSIHSY